MNSISSANLVKRGVNNIAGCKRKKAKKKKPKRYGTK